MKTITVHTKRADGLQPVTLILNNILCVERDVNYRGESIDRGRIVLQGGINLSGVSESYEEIVRMINKEEDAK